MVIRRARMGMFIDTIILLSGWKRALLAALAGALTMVAYAPFHVFPVMFFSLSVLVWLLDGAVDTVSGRFSLRRFLPAFKIGWWFGFGAFVTGLHWITEAFFVDADTFGWLAPVALIGLPAVLALFTGLGTSIARLFWTDGWGRIPALALGLGLTDWLRSVAFTGFPWNLFGGALAANDVLMQGLSLVGIYGYSALAIMIFAAPAALLDPADPARRLRFGYPAFAGLLLIGLALFGTVRLFVLEQPKDTDTRIRIVQPNIPQAEKWVPANADRIFKTYLTLSERPQTDRLKTSAATSNLKGIDLLIWPESAFPFLILEKPAKLSALAALLPKGTHLISGAARADSEVNTATGKRDVYNSIFVFNDQAEAVAAYDKTHLVPFGEYLPFQSLLERIGLEQLTRVQGGFSAGRSRQSIQLDTIPGFSPLICYEAIFSEPVVDQGPRPRWILNVTNDAWFGSSIGPRQHLHHARIRATEEGLPLIRSANTGISALIDAKGRLRTHLATGQSGVIDAWIPQSEKQTFYTQYRSGIMIVFFLSFISLCVSCRIRNLNKL